MPCALLLTVAGLRDVAFAQLCFLMGAIRLSVAPALRPGRWSADPQWLSTVTRESHQGCPSERALTASSQVLLLLLFFASGCCWLGARVEPGSGKHLCPPHLSSQAQLPKEKCHYGLP